MASMTIGTPALTTVFTAPSSCSTQWFYYTYPSLPVSTTVIWRNYDLVKRGNLDPGCFPPSYSLIYGSGAYSPGICPLAYSTVYETYRPGNLEGYAICCPSGYSIETFSFGLGAYHQCISTYTKSTTASLLIYLDNGQVSLVPATLTTVGPGIAVSNSIEVAWRSQDISLFLESACPTFGLGVVTTASSTSRASSSIGVVSPSSSPQALEILSLGAKVGIGIGLAVLVSVVVLILLLVFWCNPKAKQRDQTMTDGNAGYAKPELDAIMTVRSVGISEVGSGNQIFAKLDA